MKTDLSTYNNDWYRPGGSLKRLSWYFINVLFFENPLNPSSGLKVFFLKCFGAQVGKGVVIKPGVNIKYPWKLSIGDFSWIGEKVWIDNLADVNIGSHVCISQGAMLLCGNHNYKKSTFDLIIGGITVKNGAWIGAKSVVCPGVVLKNHSVLSVNSVATKDLEAFRIYQGNPAVLVRNRITE
ncbi:WcaF family extracellular polysaccharide biosynthesis acetyltransferase [Mangrovimonas sp. DI 80]|uniref:WcaF family extracellular polysaccharide biosynthesis acetyltransferase n=1 Tax=Mangrovimonas sp. DI 80 TaxID=1779330 RepID=UPI000976A0EA|nr:WcaF family extracellular polysaccharide biosynthesis acetyltransferase [Mangrovimonas sp. DI 80]OMP31771.1 colanic acid biosynthesis acetyltransferase WcaF [Mangrovimonas sp. DI 80]